jgi:hypothetical protein
MISALVIFLGTSVLLQSVTANQYNSVFYFLFSFLRVNIIYEHIWILCRRAISQSYIRRTTTLALPYYCTVRALWRRLRGVAWDAVPVLMVERINKGFLQYDRMS